MRALLALGLLLLAPAVMAAPPTGGIPFGEWTYGVAGEVTTVPPRVTAEGAQHEPATFGAFSLPEGATGVYVKLTDQEVVGARLGVLFRLSLLAPDGEEWSVTGNSQLQLTHCPDLDASCAYEHDDASATQSTPLIEALPGVWELRARGTTNGAWTVTAYST